MAGKKPFIQTLGTLRYGTLGDDLTDAEAQIVEHVTRLGKAGKLVLTLNYIPGKSGQIEITDDLKITLPKEEKGSTIMFATPDNNLERSDPRQLQIEGLRSVDRETGEIRSLPADNSELRKVG